MKHTQRFTQQRRFMIVLPLLVTPFLTLIFWALGGGRGTAMYGMEEKNAGLNPELPDAQFQKDDKAWDKLSLYQKAQRDSIRYNEAKRNDPYFKLPPLKEAQDSTKKSRGVNTSIGKKRHFIDDNEERVNRKLAELYRSLDATRERKQPDASGQLRKHDEAFTNDVHKLEAMMEMMHSGAAEDEEMQEIQSVLDKILDIQHPQRVKERLDYRNQNQQHSSFAVSRALDQPIGTITSDSVWSTLPSNQFYGLNEPGSVTTVPEGIEAEVYGAQTLISGAIVKLRLVNDIYVNRVLIPKDQFIYGTCAVNGERLLVKISAVRRFNKIFPVSLSVFDMDGVEGIHIPGAIARDVAKQSSNQALQDIQLNSLNPAIELQAASAGIETIKNLVSKKSRLIRVSIKSGHKVLLVDTKSPNH